MPTVWMTWPRISGRRGPYRLVSLPASRLIRVVNAVIGMNIRPSGTPAA